MGKRQNHNSNAQMLSESSSNAKSSQDYAPQGFAASATSNHSSIAMNAAPQQAQNLARSVSARITPPNTCSGMAFKTHQAIANADNQKPVPNIKSSSSVRAPVPPEEFKQSPIPLVEKNKRTSSHVSPQQMVYERKPSPLQETFVQRNISAVSQVLYDGRKQKNG